MRKNNSFNSTDSEIFSFHKFFSTLPQYKEPLVALKLMNVLTAKLFVGSFSSHLRTVDGTTHIVARFVKGLGSRFKSIRLGEIIGLGLP